MQMLGRTGPWVTQALVTSVGNSIKMSQMHNFFLPTSRNVLPTFQKKLPRWGPFCPDSSWFCPLSKSGQEKWCWIYFPLFERGKLHGSSIARRKTADKHGMASPPHIAGCGLSIRPSSCPLQLTCWASLRYDGRPCWATWMAAAMSASAMLKQ